MFNNKYKLALKFRFLECRLFPAKAPKSTIEQWFYPHHSLYNKMQNYGFHLTYYYVWNTLMENPWITQVNQGFWLVLRSKLVMRVLTQMPHEILQILVLTHGGGDSSTLWRFSWKTEGQRGNLEAVSTSLACGRPHARTLSLRRRYHSMLPPKWQADAEITWPRVARCNSCCGW